jgi:hypothetical protein
MQTDIQTDKQTDHRPTNEQTVTQTRHKKRQTATEKDRQKVSDRNSCEKDIIYTRRQTQSMAR